MSRIMVRYKVKPKRAETNAELVRAVYEELQRVRPSHIRYVTFQLDDGVTFIPPLLKRRRRQPKPARRAAVVQACS